MQGEDVVGERPFQLAYANQYIRRMSKREMRIRVHSTLMSIPVAVFMASLKPHDQGIYPFPERALGHCVSCSGPLATYVAAYRAYLIGKSATSDVKTELRFSCDG